MVQPLEHQYHSHSYWHELETFHFALEDADENLQSGMLETPRVHHLRQEWDGEVTISLAVGNAREESRQGDTLRLYNPGELGTVFIEKVGTSNQVFKLGVSQVGHELSYFFGNENESRCARLCLGISCGVHPTEKSLR